MTKYRYKALACLLAAVLTAAPLTGCGGFREKDGATLEITMDNSYRTTKYLDGKDHSELLTWGNKMLLTMFDDAKVGETSRSSLMLYHNLETGETKEFSPQCLSDRDAANHLLADMAVLLPDGRIGLCCREYRDGSFSSPIKIYRRCMEIYDADMNYLETKELPEEAFDGQYPYRGGCWTDDAGNWYWYDTYDEETDTYFWEDGRLPTMLKCYDKDFAFIGNIRLPSGKDIIDLVPAGDGSMYMLTGADISFDGEQPTYEIYRLTAADGTCTSEQIYLNPKGYQMIEDFYSSIRVDLVPGTNGYDFYYTDALGLHGCKDGEITQVISWINSDVAVGSVWECYSMENGEFVLDYFDKTDANMWHASPRTEEEMENTELISLATVGMFGALQDEIISYNKQETGYRIMVVDYSTYNTRDDKTIGMTMLREDMLDGIVADMICTDGMNFESLASKNMFGDWYALMDADEAFNREDYLANFFEAYEYDEKLIRLACGFRVRTAAAKTEFAGTEMGLTNAEYMALSDALPETMDVELAGIRDYMLDQWFGERQNQWIDRYTTTCHFDDPAFVRQLEMLAEYPTWEELELMGKDLSDLFNSPQVDGMMVFQKDRALMEICTLTQPLDYRMVHRCVFRDAPVTWIGYPMSYECGNGGIFETDFTVSYNPYSKQKEAIWSFMKHLLGEEYQEAMTDCFPVHEGVLDEKLEQTTQMVNATVDYGMSKTRIGPATEEEMASLKSYLQGVRAAYYADAVVESILKEEFAVYLAGDRSAEDTAAQIQSRVMLYLSEQS